MQFQPEDIRTREEIRLQQQLVRAQNRGLLATLTLEEWLETVAAFAGFCAYCQQVPFEALDHVIPLSMGYGTVVDNCVPACTSCNSRKGKRVFPLKSDLSLLEKVERVRAFLAEMDYTSRQASFSDSAQTVHFQPGKLCYLGCGNVATVAIVRLGKANQPLAMLPICRSCSTSVFYSYEQNTSIVLQKNESSDREQFIVQDAEKSELLTVDAEAEDAQPDSEEQELQAPCGDLLMNDEQVALFIQYYPVVGGIKATLSKIPNGRGRFLGNRYYRHGRLLVEQHELTKRSSPTTRPDYPLMDETQTELFKALYPLHGIEASLDQIKGCSHKHRTHARALVEEFGLQRTQKKRS